MCCFSELLYEGILGYCELINYRACVFWTIMADRGVYMRERGGLSFMHIYTPLVVSMLIFIGIVSAAHVCSVYGDCLGSSCFSFYGDCLGSTSCLFTIVFMATAKLLSFSKLLCDFMFL